MAVAAWAALHLWLLGLLIAGRPWRAGRRWWAGWALAVVALLVWWHTLRPSNDRDWADEVSRMPRGTVQGDHVRLQDVRNFDWRGDADYDARWDTRDYDLSRLRSVDMILSTWGMPAIAHTLVSFGFDDGQRVVFSVEIRKERGEQFSGTGRLLQAVRAERDRRRRARHRAGAHRRARRNGVDLQSACRPRRCARFLSYVDTANALRAEPRFYHTVSANCTTIIYQMVRAIVPGLPVDYRLLLSGYLPEYLYEHGGLDTSRPLDAIRRDADITQRAAGRATRRRSRKPYANLSCPPTMKHSSGSSRAAPRCC